MGTDKRQRKKANRAARIESEQKEARRRGAIRRAVFLVVLVVGVLGLALLFNLLSGGDDPAAPVTTSAETDAGSAADPDPATPDPGAAADADADADGTETETEAATEGAAGPDAVEPACPAEDGTSPQQLSFSAAPPMCIDPSMDHSAVVRTNLGEFTIDLDDDAAPQTVNNFVFLSRYQYYDGVEFHRIVPGFVVQGGDPTGDPPGTGGPGYTFADELPEEGAYQLGSVAMANSGPDTNGSQFFVVTGEDGVALPPLYSLFGQVTEGFDVVEAIEATGGTDEPAVIEDVTITES